MAAATLGGPGVAVGGSASSSEAAVWLSADAATWERVRPPPSPATSTRSAARATATWPTSPPPRRGLVAGGGDAQESGKYRAAIWVSATDGRTWSRAAHDDAVFGSSGSARSRPGPDRRPSGGRRPVQTRRCWVSPDGATWTLAFVGEENEVMKDVVAWGGRFYAVGYAGLHKFCQDSGWETVPPASRGCGSPTTGSSWERLRDAARPESPAWTWPAHRIPEWELWRGGRRRQRALFAMATPPARGRHGRRPPACGGPPTGRRGPRRAVRFIGLDRIAYFPTALSVHEGRLLIGHSGGSIWGSADGGAYRHHVTTFEFGSGVAVDGQASAANSAGFWFWVREPVPFEGSVFAVGRTASGRHRGHRRRVHRRPRLLPRRRRGVDRHVGPGMSRAPRGEGRPPPSRGRPPGRGGDMRRVWIICMAVAAGAAAGSDGPGGFAGKPPTQPLAGYTCEEMGVDQASHGLSLTPTGFTFTLGGKSDSMCVDVPADLADAAGVWTVTATATGPSSVWLLVPRDSYSPGDSCGGRGPAVADVPAGAAPALLDERNRVIPAATLNACGVQFGERSAGVPALSVPSSPARLAEAHESRSQNTRRDRVPRILGSYAAASLPGVVLRDPQGAPVEAVTLPIDADR